MDDYEALVCRDPYDIPPGALVCSAPGHDVSEAVRALEAIGSGGEVGAGARMSRLGVSIPRIREEYKAELERFIVELERRRAQLPPKDLVAARNLARWAVERRRTIARSLRTRQGVSATVVLEIRDNVKYGRGGRSYPNMLTRYRARGLRGGRVYAEMLEGAAKPNAGINQAALRGARFLKNGGRVVFVLSLATTAVVLLTASEEELPQLLFEEGGAAVGGAIGSGLAVGACLVFGVATGGWGLLACGVVGGLAGGWAGQTGGDRLYYMTRETEVSDGFVLDADELATEPMWCAP
jgi:hypothetical protein